MTGQVGHTLKLQQQTDATGTPESGLTHLQNAQEILARLRRDLTDPERRRIDWGVESRGAESK